MTNEIAVYSQIADPVSAVKVIGETIAKSQIFGCQNFSQGEILALECMTRGLSPLSLAEKYDIIQGKLSMKADAMLAGFIEAGGKYEVVEYSPEACEIKFTHGPSTMPIRITWDGAQQEKWPFKSDGTTLKDNWSTPIGRQDMLWARVVSRGVRRLAPGVVCGKYTPEEIVDIPTESPEIKPVVPETNPVVATANQATVEDASFEVVDDQKPQKSPAEQEPDPNATIDELTESGLKDAISQAKQLGVLDIVSQVRNVLANAGIEKLADLTFDEAHKLRSAIDKKNLTAWLETPLRDSAKNDTSQS